MSKSTRTVSQSKNAVAKRAARAANAAEAGIVRAPAALETSVSGESTETHSADAVALLTYLQDGTAPVFGLDIERDQPAQIEASDAGETLPVPTVPFSTSFVQCIVARMGEQSSKDLDNALSGARSGARAVDALYALPAWAPVLDTLAGSVQVSDKKNPRFVAVKALVKIVHAMQAISTGMRSGFDPYSRTILTNLVTLAGITNKSALVCLSKSIVYDELEAQQALTRHYNCSASTASTQASSTRMMLMHLGICSVVKGKKADTTTTSDDARCVQTLAMFAA